MRIRLNIYTHFGIDKNFRTSRGNVEQALNEYKKVAKELNTSHTNLVKVNQTHTDNCIAIKGKINELAPDIDNEEYLNCDAMITDKEELMLSTTNADCILIMIYDTKKNIIGNVHSGWKGTSKQILIKTIEKMKQEYGVETKDLICAISPSIRMCHFEVGIEVKEIFEKEFEYLGKEILNKIIKKQEEKWNIDTVLINKILLKNIGVKEENILDANICSVCNSDQIHSYRAEKADYGLHTAVIKLKENLIK